MKISTHFGCDTNAPTVVKYTPVCTYDYLGNENFPGEDPRIPLPIRRKVKVGPATPLVGQLGDIVGTQAVYRTCYNTSTEKSVGLQSRDASLTE